MSVTPLVLVLWTLLCVDSAVIQVTAGGQVYDPTFQFSDAGQPVTNFTARSSGTIVASSNLQATDFQLGDSQSTMRQLVEAVQQQQSTIASLQAQVLSFQTFLGHKIIRLTNAGNSKFNGHYFMFGFQDTDCRWEDGREAANLCTCIDCDGCGTDPPKLFKQGGSESSPGTLFWNLQGCGQTGRYYTTSCGNQNPAACSTWANKDGMGGPAPTFQQLTSFSDAATAATNFVVG